MATPTDSLVVAGGTLEPDSTRNSTLHGAESVLKEKVDAQVESVEEKQGAAAQDDDFPDGGLRAWLVVGGVCTSPPLVAVFSETNLPFQAMCSTFATYVLDTPSLTPELQTPFII